MHKQRIALGLVFAVVFFGLETGPAAASPDWAWTQKATFNANGNAEEGLGVAIDADGGVCVVGHVSLRNFGDGKRPWVGKYGPSGNLRWQDVAPAEEYGLARDVAVGPDGSIYVTGYLWAEGESHNVMLRKYNAIGERQWTRTYNSPANEKDEGSGIALDSVGNIYVVGSELRQDLEQFRNAWIGKYDPDGNLMWTRSFDGSSHHNDIARSVAIDAQDRIYIAGSTAYRTTVWLRSYDTEGTILWDRILTDIKGAARDIAIDTGGNLLVTGFRINTINGRGQADAWLGKFNSAGALLWERSYDGATHDSDGGHGVAVDRYGNAYVTGKEFNRPLGVGHTLLLLGYSPDGELLWQEASRGFGQRGYGVAVDNVRQSLCVTGSDGDGILTAQFLLPGRVNGIVANSPIGSPQVATRVQFQGDIQFWEFGYFRESGQFQPVEDRGDPFVGTAYRLGFRKRRDAGDIIVPLDHRAVHVTQNLPMGGDSFKNTVIVLDYNMNGQPDMEVELHAWRPKEGLSLVHVPVE